MNKPAAPQRANQGTFRSLWRDLWDGRAGPGTRILVSLIVALVLCGMAIIAAILLYYLLGPGVRRSGPQIYIRTTDDMLAVTFLLAGLVYLAALFAIWSRHRKKRPMWLGAALTLGIFLMTVIISFIIYGFFSGSEEQLIIAVWFLAGAVTLYAWLQVYRQYSGGRALYGEDGLIDLRCPKCDYRMVGLRESRCPECGQAYTIDELMANQDFEVLRLRRAILGPPEDENTPRETPPQISPVSATDDAGAET